MLASENENITRVYDSLKVISEEENPKMSCEVREAKIQEQITMMKVAQENGKTEGEVDAARNLFKLGADIDLIIKAIDFQESRVLEIKKEHRTIISEIMVKIRHVLRINNKIGWVEELMVGKD